MVYGEITMKRMSIIKSALSLPLVCLFALFISAQSGGPYVVTQSVIVNGGGSSADAIYEVGGTIAQPAAGVLSSGGGFAVRGGFWQSFFAPTAASVAVGGQITTIIGQPIRNVRVMLIDAGGTIRTAVTNSFGYFRFDEVEVGNVYIVSATHRNFEFAPFAVMVTDEIKDLVITPAATK